MRLETEREILTSLFGEAVCVKRKPSLRSDNMASYEVKVTPTLDIDMDKLKGDVKILSKVIDKEASGKLRLTLDGSGVKEDAAKLAKNVSQTVGQVKTKVVTKLDEKSVADVVQQTDKMANKITNSTGQVVFGAKFDAKSVTDAKAEAKKAVSLIGELESKLDIDFDISKGSFSKEQLTQHLQTLVSIVAEFEKVNQLKKNHKKDLSEKWLESEFKGTDKADLRGSFRDSSETLKGYKSDVYEAIKALEGLHKTKTQFTNEGKFLKLDNEQVASAINETLSLIGFELPSTTMSVGANLDEESMAAAKAEFVKRFESFEEMKKQIDFDIDMEEAAAPDIEKHMLDMQSLNEEYESLIELRGKFGDDDSVVSIMAMDADHAKHKAEIYNAIGLLEDLSEV